MSVPSQALPGGWTMSSLGELGEVVRGVTYDKSQVRDSPAAGFLPLLRATNIGRELSLEDLVYVPDTVVSSAQRLRMNDMVIAASSGSLRLVGKAAQLRREWDGTFGAFCAVFRPNSQIRPGYLALFMESPAYRDRVSKLAAGNNINNLKREHLLNMPVPLPPRAEQDRIVAAVEACRVHIDAGIRYFTEALVGAERMHVALADELWDGSKTERLQDLLAASLKNGRSVPTAESGFPVLRLTALRHGFVDLSETKIGAWTDDVAQPFLVKRDDFLVARGNGSLRLVGRGGLVVSEPPPVAFPDTLIRVRVDAGRMSGRFLRLVWHSSRVRAQIEKRAHTSAGIYKVNQDMLRDIEVPVPTLKKQASVVSLTEERVAALGTVESSLGTQLSRSSDLMSSMLHLAFAGGLTCGVAPTGQAVQLAPRAPEAVSP